MTLPLHLLRAFVAVAESGGFSRAAEALHVSQPAISKAVKELEEQLGAGPLLDRGAGRPRLTEAGAMLAARARELFAIERTAEEEVRLLKGLGAGSVSVGASTTVATYHLPPLLARFHAAHPAVTLRLISANTHDIADLLAARDVDVAIVEGPVDDARVETIPWRTEMMVVIAAAAHPLAASRTVSASALAQELFVTREPGSGTRDVAAQALASLAVHPARTMEVGSTEAIKQVVAAGVGIAVVARAAAADQVALGTLVERPVVPTPDFRRALNRLRLLGRQASPAAARFETLLSA